MTALDKYRQALGLEWKTSGQKPCVAIIGTHDYDELEGDIQLLFGALIKVRQTNASSHFTIDNVRIFRARSFQYGFFFGTLEELEPEVELVWTAPEKAY